MSKVSVITSVDCTCGVYLAKASVRMVLIAVKVRCGCCIAASLRWNVPALVELNMHNCELHKQ